MTAGYTFNRVEKWLADNMKTEKNNQKEKKELNDKMSQENLSTKFKEFNDTVFNIYNKTSYDKQAFNKDIFNEFRTDPYDGTYIKSTKIF
jgi:mannose-6-phosphate isomerase class I